MQTFKKRVKVCEIDSGHNTPNIHNSIFLSFTNSTLQLYVFRTKTKSIRRALSFSEEEPFSSSSSSSSSSLSIISISSIICGNLPRSDLFLSSTACVFFYRGGARQTRRRLACPTNPRNRFSLHQPWRLSGYRRLG